MRKHDNKSLKVTQKGPQTHPKTDVIPIYSPTQKKVFHKSEGKMPKKMKMTLQRAENLVHVKRHYGDSICKEIFFLF